jgi:hypothetical protein
MSLTGWVRPLSVWRAALAFLFLRANYLFSCATDASLVLTLADLRKRDFPKTDILFGRGYLRLRITAKMRGRRALGTRSGTGGTDL